MAETRETRQKKLIYEEINRMKFFFTAESLFNKISEKDKSIGIATIYRFLRDLKKNRKIHSYVCDRKNLYSSKNLNHNHFVCEMCGKIEHLKINRLDFIKSFVAGDVCHFQIEVTGVCISCKKNNVYK
jgi:Fe2+ or Zn2+ uptake regulation protein